MFANPSLLILVAEARRRDDLNAARAGPQVSAPRSEMSRHAEKIVTKHYQSQTRSSGVGAL